MNYYIGIDIGGMSVKGGLCNEHGEILLKRVIKADNDKGYVDMIATLATLVQGLLDEKGLTPADIQKIGIGIPGTADNETGVLVYANNLHIENLALRKGLRAHFDIPVVIGNDANCAVLGEVMFGSAKGAKDAVFITLGTGVGSGLVLNGKLYEGRGGAGAEAGHMVIRTGGIPCTCGRKGCWESYASATALMRLTKEASEKHPESLLAELVKKEGRVSGKTAFVAARQGDKTGARVVSQYVGYVAAGITNLVNIFRPEVVIIGGGVSNEGDYLISRIQRRVSRDCFGGSRNPYVKVVKAELLNDAGLLGAVALCLNDENV